ncbi:MAG: glycosyltransferase family 2 protein [Chloroflexota bacterium]|nr:glycosyltransferase family 2 protein [Chloroflexota bacterium]MBI5702048.1 glycosyltransferase family 2 protein [Chloroflexota bacterium]
MTPPKVSVIIPTYGGAAHLGEAIQSVLDQTWQDFELIVVDDASPDNTEEVVACFGDSRLRYIRHETNRGVALARKTGIMAAQGEIIAHLDQDDLYHPDKLRLHVEFLDSHPEIGFTYNSRFELYPTSGAIREILRPSPRLTLEDFALAFPLAPSVWVQRREWAVREEIWQEPFYRGREIVICGRLYMAGCKFAMIDRALNYRRYHKNRIVKNIARQCEAERACQQIIFDDPRCPSQVRTLRDIAASNIYAMWMYVAYLQGEYDTAQDFLLQTVRLNPWLMEGTPPHILNDLVIDSIDDEGESLEDLLRRVFENLPQELASLRPYYSWAVMRGYLMQGVRAVMWNRLAEADAYFSHVAAAASQLDAAFLQWLVSHLLAYEAEYGTPAALDAIRQIASRLERLGVASVRRTLQAEFFTARAFDAQQWGIKRKVLSSVTGVLASDPFRLWSNRGLLAALFHSIPFLEMFTH